ncbi:hypothetical protein [Micromonospora sp. NPDC023956]|uniref:hypothetical protein n=1 Tax=Micromonospora sp. NPDC023956 TaxID=3155722 RepID=UPI0033D0924C
MYYLKRPTPAACIVAGALLGVGAVAAIARTVHTFTSAQMIEPVARLAFVVATICIIGGGLYASYLRRRIQQQEIAALKVQLTEERARRAQLEVILAAVREVDARVEVNGVRLSKLQQELREHIAAETTQPIGHLRSITGGGGA